VVIGAVNTVPTCPSTNVRSQTFPKRKNGPFNLTCIKPTHTFTLSLPLSNSHVRWILTAPIPAFVPVYNSTDMECRLIQEAHLVEEIR
jgi:hypothetical protein